MTFAASEREFQARFWVIGAVFGIGFGVGGAIMHVATADVLGNALGPALGGTRTVLALATLFVAIAAWLRSWAEAYLKSSVVHEAARVTDRLVADGPYRHVRNPLYLANVLLALGLGALTSPPGAVFIVVAMTLVCVRLILHEEAGLLASQGESYRQYLAAVPRLLPAIRPRVPPGGGRPDWKDGIAGEGFFWSFAIGMAALTITGRALLLWIVMGIGFVLYFAQAALRKKKTTTTKAPP